MLPRNANVFMHHVMKMKQKQLLEAAAKQSFVLRSNSVSDSYKTLNVNTTETRIYVGLNDADTREQVYDTEAYLGILKDVCRNYRVPFSVGIEEGGYYHEDGEYTEENTLVLVLIDVEKDIVQKIAKELCKLFHQESILVTEDRVAGYSVNREV